MKINKAVFDIDDVLPMPYGKIEEYLIKFYDHKTDILLLKNKLSNIYDDLDYEIVSLDEQIDYLDKNIYIFLEALATHEMHLLRRVESGEYYYEFSLN